MRRQQARDRLVAEGITPDLFRTLPGKRLRWAPDARAAARRLARRSARAGDLSPLSYNLTVSHAHRFIWFRVAKVGTRTVLDHLTGAGLHLDVEHAMRVRYPTALFADYFKFGFVRHPLDRFVSAWRDKVVAHNYFGFTDETYPRMRTIENFATWTAGQDLTDLAETDHHLALQTRLVDLTQLDFLGRMESFAEDFASICDRIDVPVEDAPARRNRSSMEGLTTEAHSAELTSMVQELYRRDFQVLGY